MNKEDLEKLSELINYYLSNDKDKREKSEEKIKELRKNNMGILCLNLLELSIMTNYPETSKIACLVLLRNIIEVDSKNYWGNINKEIKEIIKQKSIDLLVNYSNNITFDKINKMVFVIEQLVHNVEDFDETWPELIDLANNLFKLLLPQDIGKIYAIIQTIKHCFSFLSNEILFHLFQYNQFFKNIFEANSQNFSERKSLLELKAISCNFYYEVISYSLNNNSYDISSSTNFISSNMIHTLKDSLSFLNDIGKMKESLNNGLTNSIENLISDILTSIEILTSPEIINSFPNEYKELNIILNSLIKLPINKYQKIIEQSFQRLLDIYLIDAYSFEQKEIIIKNYLNELFNYAYNNINILDFNNNDEFVSMLDNYNDYDQVPKVFYDVLLFVFDITSQMIQDGEKYIDIFQELENNLLNHENNIYNFIGLLLLPQIIESKNDYNKIKIYLKACINNINSQNCKIRYASSYCINYYISNYDKNFKTEYASKFFQIILQSIKNEKNYHTKCEMVSVLNCLLSHLEDENDINYILNNNKNTQNSFNNVTDILKYLVTEFHDIVTNGKDTENNLIKNELLKTFLLCFQLFSDRCQSCSNDVVTFFVKYLESIYDKKINDNLYINLINIISSYAKYIDSNFILNIILLLFNCFQYILNNLIKNNQISNLNSLILNFLPIINKNKPDFIPKIISDLINILNSYINYINENDNNHIDNICDLLNIINSSIEIVENKIINYLTEIENCIEKILSKKKNISKINSIISDILFNIVQILSKNSSNKNSKNKGKNYLEIIFDIIKHEYNSNTSLSLVYNLNKIFEIIVSFLNQNELEQVFNGIIQLIELFEGKICALFYKKNKIETEIEIEKDNINLYGGEYEDDKEDEEIIEMFDENIENLEQVNENLSLAIENMMRFSSKKKLKNIGDCLYNKIIPSLINSKNETSNNIKIAVNLIDDIIEYLDFNKFNTYILDDLVNMLIEYSKHKKAEVRQAANYGLGIFIKLSDLDIFMKYCEKVIKALKLSCSTFPLDKSENKKIHRANGLAYDNAIAALGKAIGYKNLKEVEYIIFWIDNLPLNFDETEMEEGHLILAEFILNNNYKNCNLNENYLNKILQILINIYQEENLSNQEIDGKIKTIFSNIIELRPMIEKIYNDFQNNNNINVNKIKQLVK